jgi:hypothetical protein
MRTFTEPLRFKTDLELARMPAPERLTDKLADALLALNDAASIAGDDDATGLLHGFSAPLAGMYGEVNAMMKLITD